MTIGLLALVLVIGACGDDDEEQDEEGMPNPASVYCIEQGGTLDIRERETGQYGVCVFSDGSECGEWDFYHGDCEPGSGAAGLADPTEDCEDDAGASGLSEGDEGPVEVCEFSDG